MRKKIKVKQFDFLRFDFSRSKYLKFKKKDFYVPSISNISLSYNKNLYEKKLKDLFEETLIYFKDFQNAYEKTKVEDIEFSEKLEMTLYDYFDKFYYRENTYSFRKGIYTKLTEKYPPIYCWLFSHYDLRYLEYFKSQKANKRRTDCGIKRKRNRNLD